MLALVAALVTAPTPARGTRTLVFADTQSSAVVQHSVAATSRGDRILVELSRVHDMLIAESRELPSEARDLLYSHLTELYL
jgi:hypothetical protein